MTDDAEFQERFHAYVRRELERLMAQPSYEPPKTWQIAVMMSGALLAGAALVGAGMLVGYLTLR
jgi:hypothetical protein